MEKAPRLTGKQLEDAVKTNGKKIGKGVSAKEAAARKNGGMPKAPKPKVKKEAPWISEAISERRVFEIPPHPAAAGGGGEEPPDDGHTTPEIPHHLRGFKDAVKTAHEALQAKLALEKAEELAQEDGDALKESIETLYEAARQAQAEGRGEDAKKLGNTIRELSRMQREKNPDTDTTRHQFGSKAEQPQLDVEAQMAEHEILEKEGTDAEQEAWDKERADEDTNLAESDARIDELRSTLKKQRYVKEATDLLKQLSAKSKQPKETAGKESPSLEDDIKAAALENVSRGKDSEAAPEKISKEDEGGIETWSPEDWKADQEAKNKKIYTTDRDNWKMTPEQWNESMRTSAAPSASAEGKETFASIEDKKLSEAVRQAALERGTIIDQKTPEVHKGFIRKSIEFYRSFSPKSRIIIGAGMLGLSIGATIFGGPASTVAWAVWAAQRGLSTLGALSAMDAATQRMKNRYVAGILTGGVTAAAFMLPSGIHYLADHNVFGIGDLLERWGFRPKISSPIGGGGAVPDIDGGGRGAKGDSLIYKNGIPPVPGYLDSLFQHPFLVRDGDNVWNLLKAKLTDANIITDGMPDNVINRKLAILQNKLDALGPNGIKDLLHIRSGNIHLIRPGETIDFSIIDKNGWLNEIK